MDNFDYNIENDTLYRNEITNSEEPNVFTVRKVPVMTKEVFKKCFELWIEEEEE